MLRRRPGSRRGRSSAASDVYKGKVDHLRKVILIFREYAYRLEAIADANKLKPSDKMSASQQVICQMNLDMQLVTPKDPRERGEERGGYNHGFGRGYLNTNGFDELLARDDMDD